MKRGEVWTVAGGPDYVGKPRPVVIVQSDAFATTNSLTICGFTTDPANAPLFRIAVAPNPRNGLAVASKIMADKITTVPKSKFGRRLGTLDEADIGRLEMALLTFLGLASPSRRKAPSPTT